MCPQPVAERDHSGDLRAIRRKHVHVRSWVHASEEPVFVPLGLADREFEAGGLERRDVGVLVRGSRDAKHDVDNRLGTESGHGCGAGVLEHHRRRADRLSNARGDLRVPARPRRVVVDELDPPRERRRRDEPVGRRRLRAHELRNVTTWSSCRRGPRFGRRPPPNPHRTARRPCPGRGRVARGRMGSACPCALRGRSRLPRCAGRCAA